MDIKGLNEKLNKATESINAAASVAKDYSKDAAEKAKEFSKGATEKAKEGTEIAKETIDKSAQAILNAVDQNGNGEVDIEDVIIMGLKTPGIKIDRAEFLKRQLFKNHPENQIDIAVERTPALAKISKEEIDKIANDVIQEERYKVSGISTALGTPGGFAMVATIPADIAQYYGYMLRVAQKLMYLYGFPQIDTNETGSKFDAETINILTICLGAMYGVAGASNAIKSMAKALASGVEKQLLRKALTKGTIYPLVKSIAKWFGVHMTKEVFAGFFKAAIPVVGGVIGGTLTYATFKPCCDRLKRSLEDTMLSNPEGHKAEEDISIETFDTNFVVETDRNFNVCE